MLEAVGFLLVLAAIIWLSYRYYGAPESEYLKVLDTIHVDDFEEHETDALREHIAEVEKRLTALDDKNDKRKKKHEVHHRLERIRLELLSCELHKRECQKRGDEESKAKDNDKKDK